MKPSKAIKIFISDEDELVTMTLKHEIEKAFSNHIIAVSTFSSITECEQFIKQKPDILIMNDNLNSSSEDAAKVASFIDQVKKDNQNAHMIIMTPVESTEIAVKSLHHGVHDYIVKNDYMFKKLRLSLIQCFTILELRRNMKKQVSLGILTIIVVFLMFGVAVSVSAYVPDSFHIPPTLKVFKR